SARSGRSFEDRELALGGPDSGRVDVIDVEPGREIEIVLRAQVPCDKAVGRPILLQGLNQIAPDGVDANRAVERDGAELDAPLTASRNREARGLEAGRADVRV